MNEEWSKRIGNVEKDEKENGAIQSVYTFERLKLTHQRDLEQVLTSD